MFNRFCKKCRHMARLMFDYCYENCSNIFLQKIELKVLNISQMKCICKIRSKFWEKKFYLPAVFDSPLVIIDLLCPSKNPKKIIPLHTKQERPY